MSRRVDAHRTTWLVNGIVLTPRGEVRAAVGIRAGRIVAIRRKPPRSGARFNVRGRYIAPGFIDLHVWGEPARVAREEIKFGTTSFLTTIGPESPELLATRLSQAAGDQPTGGARCVGVHLEGPFLNPLRAGALASRWLRPPTSREIRQLLRCAEGRWKLVTAAPELPQGLSMIRWCARHGVVVSLGHSDADMQATQRAIRAGATAVTHIFNGMRSLHHRDPGLLGEALTDDRLAAMVILDGVHVDPVAFRLLWRCKGPEHIVLVTDSIRHQRTRAKRVGGAFYLPKGILAGSQLTMIRAVRNAVILGGVSISDAVRMASTNPARVIGQARHTGALEVGKRADLVVFDRKFKVSMTLVSGHVGYPQSR